MPIMDSIKALFAAKDDGGIEKITGESTDPNNERQEVQEDPEVIAARLEQEARRRERHRKMEVEREKMRQNIREKYNIKKKEDPTPAGDLPGGLRRPDSLADPQDDGFLAQIGLAETVERAKNAVSGALETVKNLMPFGK